MDKDTSDDLTTLEKKLDLTDLEKKMLEKKAYPERTDDNFQLEIYKKAEFFANAKIPRDIFNNYIDLQKYRFDKCGNKKFEFNDHQKFLANFINPDTPYNGVLFCHGTGTGKTGASIAVLKTFFPMVEKYRVPIHVLVPGSISRENYLEELYKFLGDDFQTEAVDPTIIITNEEKERRRKEFMIIIRQYVKIMSHRGFYKKVLGEKIRDKSDSGSKFRKTDTGDFERDISIDQIHNLNNTLLIVDEAHALIDNNHGEAIKKIMKNSHNLKLILMTATPMKNDAPEIVGLINYLRPAKQKMEKSKIFTIDEETQMYSFKPGGKEYFRNMIRGYVSYLRGNDPVTFAVRNEIGTIPPGLNFTKVTRCKMMPFQMEAYESVIQLEDNLDRKSEAVANFVFPGIKKGTKDVLEPFYGINGMNEVRNQLKTNQTNLCNLIAQKILTGVKNPEQLMYLKDGKYISGSIFNEQYLKYFSIKFYEALIEINNRIPGKKGQSKIFVFSNLVRVGIALFREVLLMNGYLEYEPNAMYQLSKDTRCYMCDVKHGNHEHENHKFYPAVFMTIVGKLEETSENNTISDSQFDIIRKVFNNRDNIDGKKLKIIIGSPVMNESVTLEATTLAILLDVFFNLGRTDQAIGRTIRFCKHFLLSSPDNPYPVVDIIKYVIMYKEDELSTEENLYRLAELKYKLVKETEKIMMEEAIDCPENYPENVFQEELVKYADCGTGKEGTLPCPAVCGYQSCDFKCSDKTLNRKYYDETRHIYRRLKKDEFDFTTFSPELARQEINDSKNKIKNLFRLSHFYTLQEIIDYVKSRFPVEKRDLFDNYFVYRALDELIPLTVNDFNNFHDTFLDKYNNQGYIIYRDPYYLFQPFNKPESLPMVYRRLYRPVLQNKVGLKDYLESDPDYNKFKDRLVLDESVQNISEIATVNVGTNIMSNYDFQSNRDYYEKRKEFAWVGIIDRESAKRKTKTVLEIKDVFKIRPKRPPAPKKKRAIGLPSYKGAVCDVSNEKDTLLNILKAIGVRINDVPKSDGRSAICQTIKDRLFTLEKYKPGSEKITYLIIPANHPTIPFPLNLDDRIDEIIKKIKDITKLAIKPKIDKKKVGTDNDLVMYNYTITIKNSDLDRYNELMESLGFKSVNGEWVVKLI